MTVNNEFNELLARDYILKFLVGCSGVQNDVDAANFILSSSLRHTCPRFVLDYCQKLVYGATHSQD